LLVWAASAARSLADCADEEAPSSDCPYAAVADDGYSAEAGSPPGAYCVMVFLLRTS
jgi:hypothetical protein